MGCMCESLRPGITVRPFASINFVVGPCCCRSILLLVPVARTLPSFIATVVESIYFPDVLGVPGVRVLRYLSRALKLAAKFLVTRREFLVIRCAHFSCYQRLSSLTQDSRQIGHRMRLRFGARFPLANTAVLNSSNA